MKLLLLLTLFSSIAFSQSYLSPEKWEARQNLYDLEYNRLQEADFVPKKIHQSNRHVIREIEQLEITQDSKRVTALKEKELRKLLNYAIHHPVAGVEALKKYDPNGSIGFCFGRALFIHLELLRRGVAKESIKKVFVVGEMLEVDPTTEKSTVWQFHVATAVKGTDGQWWVFDPSYNNYFKDLFASFKKTPVVKDYRKSCKSTLLTYSR